MVLDAAALPGPLADAWVFLKPYASIIIPELGSILPNVTIMLLGIAIYGILIFHFYRFLGKRDVFELNVQKYKWSKERKGASIFNTIIGIFKYGLIFPFVVSLWFSGFSLMLFLMAKNIDLDQILLISVVFVSAIRLTSYYTQDLSNDMAKMIPFALLGIAIVDPNFFVLELFFDRLSTIPEVLIRVAAYFIFLILLEWILRLFLFFKRLIFGDGEEEAAS